MHTCVYVWIEIVLKDVFEEFFDIVWKKPEENNNRANENFGYAA